MPSQAPRNTPPANSPLNQPPPPPQNNQLPPPIPGYQWTLQPQQALQQPPPMPNNQNWQSSSDKKPKKISPLGGTIATLIVFGPIFFFAFVFLIIAAGNDSPAAQPRNSSSNTSATSSAKTTTSSNVDGQFKFEILAWSCHENIELSDSYSRYPGSFCLIEFKVSNVGDKERNFSGDNSKLLDDTGREFSYFDELLDGEFKYVIGESINPGFYQTFKLAYKIPPQTEIVGGRFHDSFLSDGVELKWKTKKWETDEDAS